MSWVTIIWSMIASACLTLAAIYLLVWYRNRTAWAHLLFSVTAASTAGFAFCELWMMRAQTPAELVAAMRWAHVPLFFWLVSITWFVRIYLGAGRRWLAWTICGLRAFYLLLTFLAGTERQLPRDHESAAHPVSRRIRHGPRRRPQSIDAVRPVRRSLLILVFVADASVTAWRRGDRRKALMVGGSVEFFLLAGLAYVLAGALGKHPGADCLQPVLPGPGRGDGVRVEP